MRKSRFTEAQTGRTFLCVVSLSCLGFPEPGEQPRRSRPCRRLQAAAPTPGRMLAVEKKSTADRKALGLAPRQFRTVFGGLFLFASDLARMDQEEVAANLPGSGMIPANGALRALLALKLWGIGRKGNVMPEILDEGIALFTGLVSAKSILPQKRQSKNPHSRAQTPRPWGPHAGPRVWAGATGCTQLLPKQQGLGDDNNDQTEGHNHDPRPEAARAQHRRDRPRDGLRPQERAPVPRSRLGGAALQTAPRPSSTQEAGSWHLAVRFNDPVTRSQTGTICAPGISSDRLWETERADRRFAPGSVHTDPITESTPAPLKRAQPQSVTRASSISKLRRIKIMKIQRSSAGSTTMRRARTPMITSIALSKPSASDRNTDAVSL